VGGRGGAVPVSYGGGHVLRGSVTVEEDVPVGRGRVTVHSIGGSCSLDDGVVPVSSGSVMLFLWGFLRRPRA
jgi:hypothetical protein